MHHSRRTILAGLTAIATAACTDILDDDPTHEFAPNDAVRETDRREGDRSIEVDLEMDLEPGWYYAHRVEPTFGVEFSYEVASDTPIDVWFMEQSEYDDRWRDGAEDVQYFRELSVTGVTGAHQSRPLPAGDYRVVVSNSEAYGTEPEGTAHVDLSLSSSV